MEDNIYSKFQSDNLILRDELAIDRTLLANERTLLAYLRSGVALLIAGVSIMNFSQHEWYWIVGVACLPSGIIAVLVGMARYRRMNKSIAHVRNRKTPSAESHFKDGSSSHMDSGQGKHQD
jgi:putative membrane protein